jgi:hypothetical protein
MKKIISTLLTLTMLFSVTTVLAAPATASAASKTGKKYVAYKTVNKKIKKEGIIIYKSKAKYPQLKSKSKAAKKVNNYIKKKVKNQTDNIEKMAKTDYSYNGISFFKSLSSFQTVYYYICDVDVKFVYNAKGKYSFKMSVYNYALGAHGETLVSGLSFSKKTGKKISNSKLTKYSGKKLKQKIVNAVKKKIDANPQNYYNDALQIVKNKKINKFNIWLKGKYIYVYFNQYELSVYAVGPTQIKIK